MGWRRKSIESDRAWRPVKSNQSDMPPVHVAVGPGGTSTRVETNTVVMVAGKSAKMTPQLSPRSEEHTSELQSHSDLVCRLLLEKKKKKIKHYKDKTNNKEQ